MRTYNSKFDSVGDFLAYLHGCKMTFSASAQRKNSDGFHEFQGWQECQTALRTGWQDGVDAVNAKSARLEAILGSSVMRESYSPATTGQFFDVGLVMSGEPECWLETTQEETGSKVVTIGINACISGAVNKRTIIERGAATCALVKLLETQGKSVRVVYGVGLNVKSDMSGDKLQLEIVLKREGDPLDLDTLAFWLVCPDAFRRLCFRFIESQGPIWSQVGSSYGFPDKAWNPEADVKIPAIYSSSDWTEERTQGWIKSILKAQGIALD